MGLDMYLRANKHVSGYSYQRESKNPKEVAEAKLYDKLAKVVGMKPCDDSPSFNISATIGYWRKANAIHKWFVDNVQDGVDECQHSYVSREKLAELRQLCQEVLDTVKTVPGQLCVGTTWKSDGTITHDTQPGQVISNATIAKSKLPTQGGFFFGATEYDEFYLQDLKDTIAIIDNALNNPTLSDCDFEYHSSW